MNMRKRIVTGGVLMAASLPFLLYGAFNILERLEPERTTAPLSLAVGVIALVVGGLLFIDGRTAVRQMERRRRGEIGYSVASQMSAAFPKGTDVPAPAGAPIAAREHPHEGDPIPGRHHLEEPATKKCPACGGAVYKEARVCRFCGHGFGVTLRLKVYGPEDKAKHAEVVRLLSAKLGMSADDVSHLLFLGMRFKYDSAEKLDAARKKFEAMGCRTEVYEKADRQ